jgi:hypothetical protein
VLGTPTYANDDLQTATLDTSLVTPPLIMCFCILLLPLLLVHHIKVFRRTREKLHLPLLEDIVARERVLVSHSFFPYQMRSLHIAVLKYSTLVYVCITSVDLYDFLGQDPKMR